MSEKYPILARVGLALLMGLGLESFTVESTINMWVM
jgi:hypothetical protein